MASMRGVVWGSWMITVMLVTRATTAEAAGSGARKLRADPLSALEKHDLIDLLDIELDDMFLVPKVMLQDPDAPALEAQKKKNRQGDGNVSDRFENVGKINREDEHRQRNLQASQSPSPSPATAAPTGGSVSGGTSSYSDFSLSTSSPSATPITAAPSIGGLHSSASPTAMPTAAEVDDDSVSNEPREVAAASKWGGGGGGDGGGVIASAWIAAVAGMVAIAVLGIF